MFNTTVISFYTHVYFLVKDLDTKPCSSLLSSCFPVKIKHKQVSYLPKSSRFYFVFRMRAHCYKQEVFRGSYHFIMFALQKVFLICFLMTSLINVFLWSIALHCKNNQALYCKNIVLQKQSSITLQKQSSIALQKHQALHCKNFSAFYTSTSLLRLSSWQRDCIFDYDSHNRRKA